MSRLQLGHGDDHVPITTQGGITIMRKITLPLVALVAAALAVSLAGPAFGGAHVTGSANHGGGIS